MSPISDPHTPLPGVRTAPPCTSPDMISKADADAALAAKSEELTKAQAALKATAALLDAKRAELDTILDSAFAATFFVRKDWTIARANLAAVQLFRYNGNQLAQLSILELFETPDQVKEIAEMRMAEMGTAADTTDETIAKRRDGTTFPIGFGVTLIENVEGLDSLWIIQDFTRRKHYEQKRRALELDLAQSQKLEALGTLASGVAHEINTPIQYVSDNMRFLHSTFEAINTLLNWMSEEKAASEAFWQKAEAVNLRFLLDEAPKAINQSLVGLDQVVSIVRAIKSFAHPDHEEKTLTDLNETIQTTVTVARNQWKYVADLNTSFDLMLQKVPCHVGGINQVLLNLVVNAADAITEKKSEERGKIMVETKSHPDGAEILITDNGCGMSIDVKERIFDPFFTTKGVGKGSGQGLSIAYNIIKVKHGGTIDCTSKPGVGTTFRIFLPASPTEARDEAAP